MLAVSMWPMKTTIALFALLFSVAAHATPPDYWGSREWVELRATNHAPEAERIFVGRQMPEDQPDYAAFLRFRKGITFREVIDQTPFKGTAVCVCILPRYDKGGRPPKKPFRVLRVAPSERPRYKLKNFDMIWLYEDGPVLF